VQSIGAALLAQFDVVMDAVGQAIEFSPDAEWTAENSAGGAPVRQVYHMLGALDMYCMKQSWGWDKRFMGPDGHFSWDTAIVDPPDRREMEEYRSKLQSHIREWLPKHDDAQFLSDASERKRGKCLLDEMLYILRHCHQHLGEIEVDYHIRGLRRPEWKW
jgi:DinB family protein